MTHHHDIEDHDIGFYGSFGEYAARFIPWIEAELASTKRREGNIDMHQFVPSTEVLTLLSKHFAGRAEISYLYCGDDDECNTHDGHIFWRRCE